MNARSEIVSAIKNQKTDYAISLLNENSEILNELLQDGKSALHLAVESGKLKLVRALTAMNGININIRTHIPNTSSDGMTPVFLASYCKTSSLNILTHLIKQGADTSIATTNGQTPLTVSVWCNIPKRISVIINTKNTNINSIISGQHTALINAVMNCDASIVESILSIPGNNTLNHKLNGESALFIAVKNKEMKKILALLATPGIDIEAARIPGDGKTALQFAEENSFTEIANLIKEKKILLELEKKVDTSGLAINSPLIKSCSKKNENPTHQNYPSYSQYLITQRKLPNKKTQLDYLNDLNLCLSNETNIITPSEKLCVESRRLWSDVVSEVNRMNADDTITHDAITKRLNTLGYEKNTDVIIENCIEFLKNNSAIVMTFNAKLIMKHGLSEYQTRNMFEHEKDIRGRDNTYKSKRDATENSLFQKINPELYEKLMKCFMARPRYAALILLDRNQTIEAITNYGDSFVVFHDLIKLNSLFNPGDSMDSKYNSQKDYLPCTYHHFEYILFQCDDSLLNALAKRVTTGLFPKTFTQQYKGDSKNGGYIEVLLPAINLLDPSCVQHIHINTNEYKLTEKECNVFSSLGITITNDVDNPYKKLNADFMQSVEKNNLVNVKHLLQCYPALIKLTNYFGQEPIHLAAKYGYTDIVLWLIKKGADINKLGADGKAPLHHAVESGNLELVQALTAVNGININIRTHIPNTSYLDGMTPVFLASYCKTSNLDILIHLIKQGADTSIATTNGQTPLTTSAWHNMPKRVSVIINTKNTNINSIISGQHTALINAVMKCDAPIIESILCIPGNNTINHKLNGESALFIAVKNRDAKKVEVLLSAPGIDIEAARLPGDGKTIWQMANENNDIEIINILNLHYKGILIQIEQDILKIKFPMIGYGETISLENGESKSVPPTIATLWKSIQLAKDNANFYETLFDIKNKCKLALESFSPFRDKEITENFYKKICLAGQSIHPQLNIQNTIPSTSILNFFAKKPSLVNTDNDESIVREIEMEIINTEFPMKSYGTKISLENGEYQYVPTTVAEHWKFIQLAKYQLISYSDALKKIKESSATALNSFSFNRNRDITENYYKRTLNAELHFLHDIKMKI